MINRKLKSAHKFIIMVQWWNKWDYFVMKKRFQ